MASPKFDIAGTVYDIPPPRDGKYHSIVVEIEKDGKYPQTVPFDCKAEIAAKLGIGDEVIVSFNLRGRKWTKPGTGEVKYFGSVQAWKVEITKRGDQDHAPPPPPNGGGWGAAPDGEEDPIPF